ncbi:MAG: FIG00388368: hypothetical protein [uncultured Sulfurovum sp.]|uniref:Glycosyltransferase RgtA/B/C/D-like domain-containing protein n=1 Tax=uncultured Sulfurovum sp. TaxID=269237 RepID=A0A6S6SMJ2_9BACT|nr:MAG: FIG00388368: hypothetical protein [uncultured Sulfurovum sp.]
MLIFGIRLLPRVLRKDKTDSDTWYHISSVMSIYKNKYKLPECNDGFILGGKYDYPYFSHWIVSIFMRDKIIKYERFIGPTIDTLYILLGFIYLNFLLSFYEVDMANQLINFLLLMGFSSTMLKISTGPRVYSFTPRVFGELFIFIFLISIHLYMLTDNLFFLFLSMVFGGLALNTSTFGSQVLVLFSIILSILLHSFIPMFMFLGSLIFAWISSGGHYKNILLQQLQFTKQYATYGQYNHPALIHRNKAFQYVLFFKYLLQLKIKDAYIVFQRDLIFFNVFYKNFEVIIVIILLPWLNIFDSFLYYMCIVAFVVFLITSFRPFLFLGESDRYLEYIIIFATIYLVFNLEQHYIYLILFVQIVLYVTTLYTYLKSSNTYGAHYLNAMKFIKKNLENKDDYVIHGIFNTYINYSIGVLSGLKSLAIEPNYVYGLATNKKLMPNDTIYTNDFDYLYTEYGVNIIIANKKYLHQELLYDFSKFNLFYENEQFIVYKRKQS